MGGCADGPEEDLVWSLCPAVRGFFKETDLAASVVRLEVKEDSLEVVVSSAEVDGVSKRVLVPPEEVATVVLLIKGNRAGAASRFTASEGDF